MKYRFLLILLLAAQWIAAQEKVRYQISFDNAVHHEARISAVFPSLPGGPVKINMSRSSPGRYALHEFAKHVYQLSATDSKGKTLTVSRPDPYSWLVTGHDGTVNVTYTLFGNRADGTYTGITSLYAHLNMPATFMWAEGLENRPVEVTFNLPTGKNWNVATQLKPESGTTFSAPHLQYFMDSPTHIGNNLLREWTVNDRGKPKPFNWPFTTTAPTPKPTLTPTGSKRWCRSSRPFSANCPTTTLAGTLFWLPICLRPTEMVWSTAIQPF